MNLFRYILTLSILVSGLATNLSAQPVSGPNQTLNTRQQSIVLIAGFTAKGDLTQLKPILNEGLDAGLTVNEAKEVLVHLYAYCGFPRSIQGINTLMTVLAERKAKGQIDKTGQAATPVKSTETKYDQGKKVLETLTGRPETGPKTGYAAFSPEIEVFLKEHLFADIFTRDILSYADRELATVAALINLGGVEPMLQGHLNIALNVGVTAPQLQHLMALVETKIGKKEANAGKQVLINVLQSRKR